MDVVAVASGLIHEIRNPLASIITAVELIQDDPGIAEDSAMLLGIMKKETQRLNHILAEFSEYARMPEPRPSRVDISQASRAVLAELRREGLVAEAVSVDDRLPDGLIAIVDESLFGRAVHHILLNALQAMPGPGLLRLSGAAAPNRASAGCDGEMVTICIEDSGPGFTKEALTRAPQPFYSTHPERTGLGLAMASGVAETAGGCLRLENGWAPLVGTISRAAAGEAGTYSASRGQDALDRQRDGHRHGARVCLELPGTPVTNKIREGAKARGRACKLD